MTFSEYQDSAARAREGHHDLTGGRTRSDAVRGRNRGGMALAQQRADLTQIGGLHAVRSPPPFYNDGLNSTGDSIPIDDGNVAARSEVSFAHTVTVQWLTSITEGSPDVAGQGSINGLSQMSDNSDNGIPIGLGIRRISQSRFNYLLSNNPSSDFLGDRAPVGLGIRHVPNTRFEYALSDNPSADFLGDRTPIGLGIRDISNSRFEYALSANASSEFVGGGEMLGLPILPEDASNANYVTIRSPEPVLDPSPKLPIKKSSPRQAQNSGNTPSPKIPAENVAYFTERHSLNMSAKKKGKKDWFASDDEDSQSPVGAASPQALHSQRRLEISQHLDGITGLDRDTESSSIDLGVNKKGSCASPSRIAP